MKPYLLLLSLFIFSCDIFFPSSDVLVKVESSNSEFIRWIGIHINNEEHYNLYDLGAGYYYEYEKSIDVGDRIGVGATTLTDYNCQNTYGYLSVKIFENGNLVTSGFDERDADDYITDGWCTHLAIGTSWTIID